jgi:hypothetical protein
MTIEIDLRVRCTKCKKQIDLNKCPTCDKPEKQADEFFDKQPCKTVKVPDSRILLNTIRSLVDIGCSGSDGQGNLECRYCYAWQDTGLEPHNDNCDYEKALKILEEHS